MPAVWQLLLLFLLLPLSQATWGGRQAPGGDVPEASQEEEEEKKKEPSRVILDADGDLGSRVALGLLAPVVAGLVMLVLLTLFAERGRHQHTAYAAAPPYHHHHHHGESSSSSYSVLRHFDEDATKKFL